MVSMKDVASRAKREAALCASGVGVWGVFGGGASGWGRGGRHAYPLLVEALLRVQVLEQVLVLAAAEEVQVRDLEVAPVVAPAPHVAEPVVVRGPAHPAAERVREPAGVHHGRPQVVAWDAVVLLEVADVPEQARARVGLLPQRHGPSVDLLALGHLREGIVRDGAAEVDVRLQPPVPLVGLQGLQGVEFPKGRKGVSFICR